MWAVVFLPARGVREGVEGAMGEGVRGSVRKGVREGVGEGDGEGVEERVPMWRRAVSLQGVRIYSIVALSLAPPKNISYGKHNIRS